MYRNVQHNPNELIPPCTGRKPMAQLYSNKDFFQQMHVLPSLAATCQP
jgi:hypothetical protein